MTPQSVGYTVPPARTVDQRLSALEHANRVRCARARIKRLLHEGVLDITDVLTNPPPELASMKAIDLLRAGHRIGPVKATRILNVCRISHAKTVAGLSPRQRGEMIKVLMVGVNAA